MSIISMLILRYLDFWWEECNFIYCYPTNRWITTSTCVGVTIFAKEINKYYVCLASGHVLRFLYRYLGLWLKWGQRKIVQKLIVRIPLTFSDNLNTPLCPLFMQFYLMNRLEIFYNVKIIKRLYIFLLNKV